jgi:hypothetical protein
VPKKTPGGGLFGDKPSSLSSANHGLFG